MRWLPALTEDPVGSWGQQTTSSRQARQSSVESNSREGEKITNTIGKKEATWKLQRTTAGLTYVMQTSSNQNH